MPKHSAFSESGHPAGRRPGAARLTVVAAVAVGAWVLMLGSGGLQAGDILRGGAPAGAAGQRARVANEATATAAARARESAQDALARTTRAVQSVQAMQAAARAAAAASRPVNLGRHPLDAARPLPNVPDGLRPGGLQIAPGVAAGTARWTGADLPKQAEAGGRTRVNIRQKSAQALLDWETFNVGRNTTVEFDQSAGGADTGKWVAFNRVLDSTGNPSQILGAIEAQGQVYVINRNGIIFGGTSQINTRALVASSLPVNENLVERGLLNNRDAQFLFSGIKVPGGSDGTPDFEPGEPPAALGRYGDVIVQAGATISCPPGEGGNGGRVMMVGPNVTNAGTISTPSGQTILAAGLQVAVAAHAESDPSLRGLDVWVGETGDYGGTATNTGLIEALTGSVRISGREVNQFGAIESSTSVSLNGRIDLEASHGAVANPNFDNLSSVGGGGPAFLFQHTGQVNFGEGSVTRILPDYLNAKAVPGTSLPERSQINAEGLELRFGRGALVMAPNGDAALRAGVWPYADTDGDRTVFDESGTVPNGINNFYTGTSQKFFLSGGKIEMAEGSMVNVAGSSDVFVPLSHSILNIELRGAELADSPLQRGSGLRGAPLTVDIRETGVFNGRFWAGTPLGDVTGLAGIIERNAAQLTAKAGSIVFKAGGQIDILPGAVMDVSGGYFRHEAGLVKTSWLFYRDQIIPIEKATPDRVYDGVFTGKYDDVHARWGVTESYATPLIGGARWLDAYLEGAAGGVIDLTAPSMRLDGEMKGMTLDGPRQKSTPPAHSELHLAFEAEKMVEAAANDIRFLTHSPMAPDIVFSMGAGGLTRPAAAGGRESLVLSASLLDEDGFGKLAVRNPDGNITVPVGVALDAAPLGGVTLTGANVAIAGSVTAPGGELGFTTYNISPIDAAEFPILNPSGAPVPGPNDERGRFVLGGGAVLSTAVLVVDDRIGSPTMLAGLKILDGGKISIESYNASLGHGSVLDVSGGVFAGARSGVSYGAGGELRVLTGKDPAFPKVTGGLLELGAELRGYSGGTGGSLSLQSTLVQIGGTATAPNTLVLAPEFFRIGGFSKYSIAGIGAPGETDDTYVPGVMIAPGTVIEPEAASLLAYRDRWGAGGLMTGKFMKPDGLRAPVSLAFSASGNDDSYTTSVLEARGDIVMGRGARITTLPGATVSFNAQTVTVLGNIIAPGGAITISGASSFPVAPDLRAAAIEALPTVHIGGGVVLSAVGAVVYQPDAFGRRLGTVLPGGSIRLSGNILAEGGAVLDVSGTSAVMDVHPARLAAGGLALPPVTGGLATTPWLRRGVPTRIDSSGGSISLDGSEMLFSDATLLGHAGGPTATGGTLSVFSGRFYTDGAARTSADTNLVVFQHGNTIAATNVAPGVGKPVLDASGQTKPGMGYFAAERFARGGFASLDLGAKYLENAQPVPYGGNLKFIGPVTIRADGTLRLAGGGVIEADSAVRLSASHIVVGQPFRAPRHPDDPPVLLFQQYPVVTTSGYNFAPTTGPGSLSMDAALIDVGTLALLNIHRAGLAARNGDIRGNGTVSVAGDLTLEAARVYPTTLADFNIFAYDHDGGLGTVEVRSSGARGVPLSAGGNMSIHASIIRQAGVLRAPLGTITLGWDGLDLDPSDVDVDAPSDGIAGGVLGSPVAREVTLAAGSLTSVSAKGLDGRDVLIPFGLSADGNSWIDPRGVNITLSGLPEKRVTIAADGVRMDGGAVVDVSGGGDLLGFRWVPGPGGSVDLTGEPSGAWGAGTEYEPGDMVTYRGQTWSARVRHTGQTPVPSAFWTRVAESYAILPGYDATFAPYAPFNTGSNAGALGGETGFTSASLKPGDQVFLDGGGGLKRGSYTLLPRRYALLPGAYLVTPTADVPVGEFAHADGSHFVSGLLFNAFNRPAELPNTRMRFEIAAPGVIQSRVEYAVYSGNGFLGEAAGRTDAGLSQRLPWDAGNVAMLGNTGLSLLGQVRARPSAGGRGGMVDVASVADMFLVGGAGMAPGGQGVALQTSVLDSWGVESLMFGGVRRATVRGMEVESRTSGMVLDNPGAALEGPEIILISKDALMVTAGSVARASGAMSGPAATLAVAGDGALLRVSGDMAAGVTRTARAGSASPVLTVGTGATLAGAGVTLDSSAGMDLSPGAHLVTNMLSLGSGSIAIDLDGSMNGATGDNTLVLAGGLLRDVQAVEALELRSYSGIDIHGSGTFGGASLQSLGLAAGGLRGFGPGSGRVVLEAGQVTIENTSLATVGQPAGGGAGTLVVDAGVVRLGANGFSASGYGDFVINASGGMLATGKGSFSTTGNLHITTPVITGARGASHDLMAAGDMILMGNGGVATVTGGLGASMNFTGATVRADTRIFLPSGQLALRAENGNLTVGGQLDVAGTTQAFHDIVRHADAGSITLDAMTGDVRLQPGSLVTVASAAGGGKAGRLAVRAPGGVFTTGGVISGTALSESDSGAFILDAGRVDSFTAVNDALDDGGFTSSRNFRIRNGDIVVDGTTRAREFILSVDHGGLTVRGTIDASGETGGRIALSARDNLVLESGSLLTAVGGKFSNAGKGGEISLGAGAQSDGVIDTNAILDVRAGSTIDLSVAEYIEGGIGTPGSSAFRGQFTGKLHLRAPRAGGDLGLAPILGSIAGASSITAEGYKLYDLTGSDGLITGWRQDFESLPVSGTLQRTVYEDANAWLSAANHDAMMNRLLGQANGNLAPALVLAPGVEIIDRSGDLTLGTSWGGALGDAWGMSGDWNLADFRFGPKAAPGVLTLRASGNIELFNALSDGFDNPALSASPGQQLWLSRLMALNPALPVNTQSWSFQLTAGADAAAANPTGLLHPGALPDGKGSLLLGKFLEAQLVEGSGATTASAISDRFQTIRTGTGDIGVAAGRDIQLRNVFATIYTAGVALPDPTSVFSAGDFVLPVYPVSSIRHPNQGDLGAVQQNYTAQWSMAGGNVGMTAGADIGRVTMYNGELVVDSSRQMPGNWLYRRGYVDPATGLFASDAGVDSPPFSSVTDSSASTAWWIDFSNFFQGVGALGGGDVSMVAGDDIVNVDAVAPTNARMAGRDAATGMNLAPDVANLVEHGGGDVTVRAAGDIDGGIYYAERGDGSLSADGNITTNRARSPSLGILAFGAPETGDERTWLPTTLLAGKSVFDVRARGDVLLGPTSNPFLLPQGLNNKFWYKTYFNTFAPWAGADVISLGGDVTLRTAVTTQGSSNARSILDVWYGEQNLYAGVASAFKASNYQPWLRLAELDLSAFSTLFQVVAPNLRATAFAGDVNLAGPLTLFPSATGNLEIAAAGGITGLQPTGASQVNGRDVQVWTSSVVNVSDANPASVPGLTSPLAYQTFVGRALIPSRESTLDALGSVSALFRETGSRAGQSASITVKQALHSPDILHAADTTPVRLLATSGDITGFTLFSPKATRAMAGNDITDMALYLQNVAAGDVSVVSAGRDIIPFNTNASVRAAAVDAALGNFTGDNPATTVTGESTTALAGDIQINGPGVLEVLAGRNLDLGTGANFTDGTGTGITSIGNGRNPFLPFGGADIIAMAGVGGPGGAGPAIGLSGSTLDFASFASQHPGQVAAANSAYMAKLGVTDFGTLDEEKQSIVLLERFFLALRDAGRGAAETGGYGDGYAAIASLFGDNSGEGEVFTRAREIRTTSGGAISLAVPAGGVTMASSIFGNPLTPPGIVTEYGGAISMFTNGSVDIGQARIFTLRGGDMMMWSSTGDIAAGTSPRTVVTAPPTRVLIDVTSADIQTDLGGLATGGGIGVLAAVEGVEAGNVDLIAPQGTVDAGDAGIRVTGNLNIAATAVLNAANIQVAGGATGVPSAPVVAAPNIAGMTAASSATAATSNAAAETARSNAKDDDDEEDKEDDPSIIVVEVLGYGGGN